MNAQEREIFWETLCSLQGKDMAQDWIMLKDKIRLPRYLYRYRSVSMSSLDAIRTNRLYFSRADYYDDPFDTFLHINIDTIRSEFLSAFQTEESTEMVIDGVKDILSNVATEEQLSQFTIENMKTFLSNGLLEQFLLTTLSLREEIKKDVWSVCFSEVV